MKNEVEKSDLRLRKKLEKSETYITLVKVREPEQCGETNVIFGSLGAS